MLDKIEVGKTYLTKERENRTVVFAGGELVIHVNAKEDEDCTSLGHAKK